ANQYADLIETKMTPGGRGVVGDLTSAFDFANPNTRTRLVLPSTASYLPTVLSRQPDENPAVPSNQTFPQQERGIRLARALPYALEAAGSVQSDGSFRIDFLNTGDAPAVFQVRSGGNATTPPTYPLQPCNS